MGRILSILRLQHLFSERSNENANFRSCPNTNAFNNPLGKRIWASGIEYRLIRQDPYSVEAVTYLLKKFKENDSDIN